MNAVSVPESSDGEDSATGSARLCHDLRQYVAAGLLLSTTAPGREPGGQPLSLIHQQFEAISELLDAEGRHRVGVVNLTRLVAECAEVARVTYRAPVVTERSGPVLVLGDQALVRRAVGNMLDNACRAAGSTGTVSVQVEVNDESARVEVHDDGAGFGGISSGTGHGLQVVAAAVRACRGRLEISSGPGVGTSVRLCLPATRRPVRPA
ncbi:MAG TPA: HAMP domain-containing sensor histidine kinase [Kribbella sp.]|jgi:signal transduction histidine kinase